MALTLDNAFVGHRFPSGAAQDRRVWVELHAYASGVEVFSSGVVPQGKSPTDIVDPSLWLMRETMTDGAQQPVNFLWQAYAVDASALLPPAITNVPTDPKFVHSVTRSYAPPPSADRVTVVVHATPVGADVLSDLVASGDLPASVAAAMPTFDLAGTKLTWDKTNGYGCVP